MSVEVALTNAAENLGESPLWDVSTGTLLYADILCNTIHRWNPKTDAKESIKLNERVGFLVQSRKGGLIIGLGKTLAHLDLNSKEVGIVHEVEKGTDLRLNDGKCDPAGRLWAGTMAPIPENPKDIRFEGSLYCLDVDGKLHKRLSDIGISNGLAWTKDAKTMFFVDTATCQVSAFNYDITSGQIANRRVAVDFTSVPIGGMGFPDGMTIDIEDKLWVACYSAGKVVCCDPNTGVQLKAIEFPALRITSCCFGGESFNELYVTCAKPKEQSELDKYPLSGSIFRVTGLQTKGYSAAMYEG